MYNNTTPLRSQRGEHSTLRGLTPQATLHPPRGQLLTHHDSWHARDSQGQLRPHESSLATKHHDAATRAQRQRHASPTHRSHTARFHT